MVFTQRIVPLSNDDIVVYLITE